MPTMPAAPRRSSWLSILAAIALLLGTSCGESGTGIHADDARAALESALSAWKSGGKPGALASADPPILVVDSDWTNGRTLDEFRIISEEPSESDRRFNVALRLKGQAKETETRYIILGGQPLSVFREADYERVINMDNNPAPQKGSARGRGRR